MHLTAKPAAETAAFGHGSECLKSCRRGNCVENKLHNSDELRGEHVRMDLHSESGQTTQGSYGRVVAGKNLVDKEKQKKCGQLMPLSECRKNPIQKRDRNNILRKPTGCHVR